MAVLERVLSGNTRLDVDRTLSSHTLYLKLWTDRGEVALSMTASMIGPEHEAQRPIALCGQVLDHNVIAALHRWEGADGSGSRVSSRSRSVATESRESGDDKPRRKIDRGGGSRASTNSGGTVKWCPSVDSNKSEAEGDTTTEMRGGFASGLKSNARKLKQIQREQRMTRCMQRIPQADMAKTVQPLVVAAAQGFPEAQCALGYAYSIGLGVQKDEVEAVRWYRRSADQAHGAAMFNLVRLNACAVHVYPLRSYDPGFSVINTLARAGKHVLRWTRG